jgi:DNA mismatch repair protein MutS
VQFGYKVAICDQLEDPAKAKGLVKRGVTELVTPGLVTQDSVLNNKRNNYLASLYFEKNKCGIAFLDFSTVEFSTTQGDIFYIQKLLDSFSPNEIIFSKK